MIGLFIKKNVNILVFVLLCLVSILLIWANSRNAEEKISNVSNTIISPFIWISDEFGEFFDSTMENLSEFDKMQAENIKLKKENDRLRSELVLAAPNKRLLREYQMQERNKSFTSYSGNSSDLISAKVIANSPKGQQYSILIDKGQIDDIEKDYAVVAVQQDKNGADYSGIVGRIQKVGYFYSVVMLISSRYSNIGARTKPAREIGIAQGSGRDLQLATLDFFG